MKALGHLIVVTGTGTGIGKTHVTEALLRLAQSQASSGVTLGYKPVESGSSPPLGEDTRRLYAACSCSINPAPPYVLRAPVSPHLAARLEGVSIQRTLLIRCVRQLREQVDTLMVELPGGLFSPLTRKFTNAELLPLLEPDSTLLVAPDRLGALHEVTATLRAAHASGITLTTIALSAPKLLDSSSGTNATELRHLTGHGQIVALPRMRPPALVKTPELRTLGKWLFRQI